MMWNRTALYVDESSLVLVSQVVDFAGRAHKYKGRHSFRCISPSYHRSLLRQTQSRHSFTMPRTFLLQPFSNSPRPRVRHSPRRPSDDPTIRDLLHMSLTDRAERFQELHQQQMATMELFFFDREKKEGAEFPLWVYDSYIIIYCWFSTYSPVHNALVVRPAGIEKYNESRRQDFECFCALYFCEPGACFVKYYTRSGRYYARCPNDICGFRGMSPCSCHFTSFTHSLFQSVLMTSIRPQNSLQAIQASQNIIVCSD